MKRYKTIKIIAAAAIYLVGIASVHALQTEKRNMIDSMRISYNIKPKSVDSIDEMFSEGIIYGRLRSNIFYGDWKDEFPGITQDNFSCAFGGSLIYSTGYLNGFSATAGMYTTHTIMTDNTDSAYIGKDFGGAGKDTYSRFYGSGSHIDVLAISYLEYKFSKSSIKVGRQIFESTLIHSNDTKMIPNTFEGYSVQNKDIPDTQLRAAYFTRQKLRDHRDFHSILAYDSWETNPNAQDDAGAHRGLSVTNINAAGKDIEPNMAVVTIENKSIEGLRLNFDGMYIKDFFSSAIVEVNYKINLGQGYSLTPGARYFHQSDEGAGKIGGAAINGSLAGMSGNANGYKNADSVDGSAWMARIQLNKGAGYIMAGYSAINDEADLIAPWRGFPTGGYTRSMGQYNWEANTKSWMLKVAYDFGKADIITGLHAALDYAQMDYDDNKLELGGILKTDRDIVHLDVFQTFEEVPNLELKLRAAMVNADIMPGYEDDYQSYSEYRLEVNYFF